MSFTACNLHLGEHFATQRGSARTGKCLDLHAGEALIAERLGIVSNGL